MRHFLVPSAVSLALVLGLTACQGEPAPPATISAVADPAAVAKRAALSNLGEIELRAAASRAIREQRIYSPAGDNAMEIYVALLRRFPDNDAAKIALAELEPYAVIATEQSLQRDDLDESARLIALIKEADPEASALARLRDEHLRRETLRALAAAKPVVVPVETATTAQVLPPVVQTAATAPPPVAATAATALARVPAEKPEPLAALPAVVAPAAKPASVVSTPLVPVRQPGLVRDVAPRYPAMALRRGIEGNVELAFTIGADGSVNDARVVRGSPAGTFDEAALAVTRLWKFEATGQAVPSRRSIAFNLPKPTP